MRPRLRFQPSLLPLLLVLTLPVGSQDKGQAQSPELDQARQALAEAPEEIGTITASDLEAHAMTLAGPDFEGRLTGTPGQLKIADYFIKRFKDFGCKPWGDQVRGRRRDWFQRYDVTHFGLDPKYTGLYLGSKRLNEHGAWLIKRNAEPDKVRSRLVFAGDGSEQDFAKAPLEGRIAVVAKDLGAGGDREVMGWLYQAGSRADAQGARALVVCAKVFSPGVNQVLNTQTRFPGRPVVALGKKDKEPVGRRMPQQAKLPTLVLSAKDSEAVLAELELGMDQAFADGDQDARKVGTSTKKTFTLMFKPEVDEVEAVNVVALLEGSHSKMSDECLVYSCHMDHVGMAADGEVFNGADDNASGCSTVLEIAEAYGKLARKDRPRRSILFIVVSGEELGLWGSAHWADNPTWPLDKVVADINMDMLGRSTERITSSTVAVTPTHDHREYNTLAQEAWILGKAFELEMGSGDKFYQRSDHYNFAQKGIPIVFFSDDEHPDYHQVTDTPDKLEYPKMEKIARLAFLLGFRTANRDERPRKLGRLNDWVER